MVSRREAAEPETIVPPAVDTLPIDVAILDREGTIRYTNRAWREFDRQTDLAERAESIARNYFEAADPEASDVAAAAVEGLRELLAGERARGRRRGAPRGGAGRRPADGRTDRGPVRLRSRRHAG